MQEHICNILAGPHLKKWRYLLCLTESSRVIHCFLCDKNYIELSTLYMLYIHMCIIKGPVALGPAIWRRSSWSKGVVRCAETRNMTAFLIKQRCCPLHWNSQYDDVLNWANVVARGTLTRCIISFYKSTISFTFVVSRIWRLVAWK